MRRIKNFLLLAVEYVGKRILSYSFVICVVIGLSFLVTHGFTFDAYSERLVWAGIFIILAGGVVVLGVFSAGAQYGVPLLLKKPDDAKRYIANQSDIRKTIEKRYDTAIQIWIIGLTCVGLGSLVQMIGTKIR
jgi:hypothetical protein